LAPPNAPCPDGLHTAGVFLIAVFRNYRKRSKRSARLVSLTQHRCTCCTVGGSHLLVLLHGLIDKQHISGAARLVKNAQAPLQGYSRGHQAIRTYLILPNILCLTIDNAAAFTWRCWLWSRCGVADNLQQIRLEADQPSS
jgi:hypothetical protein